MSLRSRLHQCEEFELTKYDFPPLSCNAQVEHKEFETPPNSVQSSYCAKLKTLHPATKQKPFIQESKIIKTNTLALSDRTKVSQSKSFIKYDKNKTVSNEKDFVRKCDPVPPKSLHMQSTTTSTPSTKVQNCAGIPATKGESTSSTGTKKKRKSKVKRNAAMQSGKIKFISSEVFDKIKNQTAEIHSLRSDCSIPTMDQDEYPELGVSLVIKSKKEVAKKPVDVTSIPSDIPSAFEPDSYVQGKEDDSHERVEFTLLDVISLNQIKNQSKKEPELETNENKSEKKNVKKTVVCTVNTSASSQPVAKRGKEREKPKPKKPSKLKQLILLERDMKRKFSKENSAFQNEKDQNIDEEQKFAENAIRDFHQSASDANVLALSDGIINTVHPSDSEYFIDDDFLLYCHCLCEAIFLEGFADLKAKLQANPEIFKSESSPPLSDFNASNQSNSYSEHLNERIPSSFTEANILDCHSASEVAISGIKTDSNMTPDLDHVNQNISATEDNSKAEDSCSASNEKVDAAKILLHTSKFKKYCTHFVTKELEEQVHSLIDDLARFQDRLHLKDPVKARIKRRLVYGMKEIKKHLTFKKLKCIIIATDIEENTVKGGLDDLLRDIVSLALTCGVPRVFALSRQRLGKVCRKAAPVSMVGLFNYEGADKTFKKILELQEECRQDYEECLHYILENLSLEEAQALLKAKQDRDSNLLARLKRDALTRLEKCGKIETEARTETDCASEQDNNDVESLKSTSVSDNGAVKYRDILKKYIFKC